MTTFRFLSPGSPSGLLRFADAAAVGDALAKGGLAVLPTETGYMLAAVATSTEALRRAFAVKQRSLANPMHVACSSVEMAARFAVLSADARRLLGAFTPGPLTVVVPQTELLPPELVTLNGTVGIRVPDHPATLQVVAQVGAPITATSLNRSGEESRPVDDELLASLDWADLAEVPVVVDHGALRHTVASTLVRLTGPEVEVLREGPVSRADVLAALDGPAG